MKRSAWPPPLTRWVGIFVATLSLGTGIAPAAEVTAPVLGPAEAFALPRAEVRTLNSVTTGIDYKLYVSLPHSYDGNAFASHRVLARQESYPVVYLLDADYSFLIARNITDHLAERNDLPEVILVGIAYDGAPRYRSHRTRDYTPTHVPDGGYGEEIQKVSGGGPRFLEFLTRELAPAIEETYRADPGDRTLVGHSYGGLFVTFALLAEPGHFHRAIGVSPSLWYDDRLMFRRERAYAEDHASLPVRLYYAVGRREVNRQRSMVADLEAFTAQLRGRDYSGLELRADVLDDETHNSVFPRALSNGLRFAFDAR